MHLIVLKKKEKKRNIEQTKDTSPHTHTHTHIYIYKHTGMTYCLGLKHAHYAKITRLF